MRVLPRLGKDRAEEFAESLGAGVKAAGAAAVAASLAGGPLGGPFAVLAVLMQAAEVRCERIAKDPPRDDFYRRTVSSQSRVQPAPAEDPYRVIELGQATRQLSADLGAVLTAFERQLGALQREQFDLAAQRRVEVVEYGMRAANVLRYLAQAFPRLPLPPRFDSGGVRRATDLPDEMQAYLFRSYVMPSHVDRVLAVLVDGDGRARERVQRLPADAEALAEFLERWDGRAESLSTTDNPDDAR